MRAHPHILKGLCGFRAETFSNQDAFGLYCMLHQSLVVRELLLFQHICLTLGRAGRVRSGEAKNHSFLL